LTAPPRPPPKREGGRPYVPVVSLTRNRASPLIVRSSASPRRERKTSFIQRTPIYFTFKLRDVRNEHG
jgi:hypothetical protein